MSRGKLYYLATKHLLGRFDTPQHLQAFEILATDLLLRDAKIFNYFDAKNLNIEHLWPDLKASQLLLIQSETRKSLSDSSEDELFRESLEGESGIGEVKESLMLLEFQILKKVI